MPRQIEGTRIELTGWSYDFLLTVRGRAAEITSGRSWLVYSIK